MRLGIPALSPPPGVPENREYRTGYLDGDTPYQRRSTSITPYGW